jgi:hypothetical protein
MPLENEKKQNQKTESTQTSKDIKDMEIRIEETEQSVSIGRTLRRWGRTSSGTKK